MRILVTEPLHEDGIDFLRQEFEVDVRLGMSPVRLVELVGAYDALVTRSGTPVGAALLEAGARGCLRVVGRAGIGVDNIDVDTATQCGIAVVNAPLGNVRAAAEHTLALIFALSRKIPQSHSLLRQGVWGKHLFMGTEVAGKTLGIIGLGKVGSQVAQRARALDMDVIAHDPFVHDGGPVPLVAIVDLLRRSDFVSLHVPLTPLTVNMISERELHLMKRTAYLVNCARGRVVDESALYGALKSEEIAGAALDVFANEPLTGSPLLELDNVVLTPHLGGTTQEAMRASAMEVAQQVGVLLKGEHAAYVVNPEVLAPPVSHQPCTINSWQLFARVVFDCDSTLTRIEGINELAEMNGVPYEVAEMTRLAMGGEMAFEEAFARRLDLVRPTHEQLQALGELYRETLVEDAGEVVAALQYLGVEVHLVSGGCREALMPVAQRLGIPATNLHANDLRFCSAGRYAGYDAANPLSRSGGKAEVVRGLPPEERTIFVGDGASDAEVAGDVELFVGYGGVEKRGAVMELAPVFLHSESLAPLLPIAGGLEGVSALLAEPRFRPLVVKGLSILMLEGSTDHRPEYGAFFARIRKFCLMGGPDTLPKDGHRHAA